MADMDDFYARINIWNSTLVALASPGDSARCGTLKPCRAPSSPWSDWSAAGSQRRRRPGARSGDGRVGALFSFGMIMSEMWASQMDKERSIRESEMRR